MGGKNTHLIQKESIKSSSVSRRNRISPCTFPPINVTLLGSRVLEDVTKLGYSHVLLGWFLNPVASTLTRREGLGDTHRHTQEDSQEKIEAEITMMLPQTRGPRTANSH